MQVARKRTSPARPARAHRAGLRVRTRRNPRLRFWSAHSWCASDGVGSGMGRPSWGSCHQPRRYHVSPSHGCYTWLRSAYFLGRTQPRCDPATVRLSLSKTTRIDFIAVYTHAPQLPRASPPTRALSHTQDAPCGTVASRTTHTRSTHLDFPNLGATNPWPIYKPPASSVVILTLLLVKGRWTESPDFVLTDTPRSIPTNNPHQRGG
jgi:hypothetical protein